MLLTAIGALLAIWRLHPAHHGHDVIDLVDKIARVGMRRLQYRCVAGLLRRAAELVDDHTTS